MNPTQEERSDQNTLPPIKRSLDQGWFIGRVKDLPEFCKRILEALK